MRKRKVLLLGSTGSIGTSALQVARNLPERMEIVGLAALKSADKLAEQATEFGVNHVCLVNEHAAQKAVQDQRFRHLPDLHLYVGPNGLLDLVEASGADMVLISIVGVDGLRPALRAAELGMDLAVASKEILVMAGEVVTQAAKAHGVHILPIDSEHNAIFQCLQVHQDKGTEVKDSIRRLILTASGGPFRHASVEEIQNATYREALKHPTWSMGPKITIDSATLFNKGLEMIEAKWLFDVPIDKVDVIIHPQSIIHSMVEFIDHSILAQLSQSDMCFPIQYAVTWPERVSNPLTPLNFETLAKLEFEPPRHDVFPALQLAREAATVEGCLPAVFNAANEIAVEAFLKEQIRFPAIWDIVSQTMACHAPCSQPTLTDILEADAWARRKAESLLPQSSRTSPKRNA